MPSRRPGALPLAAALLLGGLVLHALLRALIGEPAAVFEPVAVPRRVFVRGLSEPQVDALLAEFAAVQGGSVSVELAVIGPIDGWYAVALPDAVHPYLFHNLAAWLQGDPATALADDAVGWSDGPTDPWRYALVRSPRHGDELAGYRADGRSLVVFPWNGMAFLDAPVDLPAGPAAGLLAARGVPDALVEATGGRRVVLALPRVGDELNARMEPSTVPIEAARAGRR